MYNILVVDDSALVRKFMCDIINTLDGYKAVNVSADGENAYSSIRKAHYNCVVMSMSMPSGDGLKILERLKADGDKTPVIAIGSSVREDKETTLKALELGAVDFVVRPLKFKGVEKETFINHLNEALDAGVHGRKIRNGNSGGFSFEDRHKSIINPQRRIIHRDYDLVAIASSTGGPQALVTLMSGFTKNIGVPVVVVQHMPEGFTASLAHRINSRSKLTVKEANEGDILKPDTVYIAKGGRHMQVVEKQKGKYSLNVYDAPPVNNLRPCADVMYESLRSCSFKHILCVVLTGMGSDGCVGIKSLRKKKNLYVMTQDEESCVVYGMPKAIYESGQSDQSVNITEMANAIMKELGV